MDITEHPSVDVVIEPGKPFPFEDGHFDLIVSASCFEHDPCFWLTFKEMTRVLKDNGHIYVSAPGRGKYYQYPGDNWRFYTDAGQALAYWSGFQQSNEKVFPVEVVEVFHMTDAVCNFNDYVCIWKRCPHKQTHIVTDKSVVNTKGPVETLLNNKLNTVKHLF